jgi:hypothetical protein
MAQQAVGDGAGSRTDHYRSPYRSGRRGSLAADAIGHDTSQEAAHLILLAS